MPVPAEVEEEAEDGGFATIAAVVENRAAEVGLALLSTDTMFMRLVQLKETSRSYTNVQSLLNACQPGRLIIVASNQAMNVGVNSATRAEFHQVPRLLLCCILECCIHGRLTQACLYAQVPMPRGSFDDTKGAAALELYATPATRGAVASAQHATQYLCHGAAGALLLFMEQVQRMQSPTQKSQPAPEALACDV